LETNIEIIQATPNHFSALADLIIAQCKNAQTQCIHSYTYAEIDHHMNEGFITFLGVDESYRRKGYAIRLLQTALTWFFADKDMPRVSLTVNERNDNALALYEKAGFALRYAGVNMRRE